MKDTKQGRSIARDCRKAAPKHGGCPEFVFASGGELYLARRLTGSPAVGGAPEAGFLIAHCWIAKVPPVAKSLDIEWEDWGEDFLAVDGVEFGPSTPLAIGVTIPGLDGLTFIPRRACGSGTDSSSGFLVVEAQFARKRGWA